VPARAGGTSPGDDRGGRRDYSRKGAMKKTAPTAITSTCIEGALVPKNLERSFLLVGGHFATGGDRQPSAHCLQAFTG
jgi:hypothetical protein